MSNGLRTINFMLAFEALRCELEGPGKYQRKRKTERHQQQDGPKQPVRCLNIIKDDVGYLKKQPGGYDIGNRYPEDVAALEFFE